MFINEVCKRCSLTKKAVEYYGEKGLISPVFLDNGYRDFSEEDISRLKKIAVLRSLGLSAAEILSVLEKGGAQELRAISGRKDLELEISRDKGGILQYLAQSGDWEGTREHLERLDRKQSILTRLLDKFPGYYGRYATFHFAPFLDEPVSTAEQREAFETIVAFLDKMELHIPKDLADFLEEVTQSLGPELMKSTSESVREAIGNTGRYLSDNREALDQYLSIKQSEEFKATPAFRLQELLQSQYSENGYYDVFIPAMRRLSRSYDEYCKALERANEEFIKAYPQAAENSRN